MRTRYRVASQYNNNIVIVANCRDSWTSVRRVVDSRFVVNCYCRVRSIDERIPLQFLLITVDFIPFFSVTDWPRHSARVVNRVRFVRIFSCSCSRPVCCNTMCMKREDRNDLRRGSIFPLHEIIDLTTDGDGDTSTVEMDDFVFSEEILLTFELDPTDLQSRVARVQVIGKLLILG